MNDNFAINKKTNEIRWIENNCLEDGKVFLRYAHFTKLLDALDEAKEYFDTVKDAEGIEKFRTYIKSFFDSSVWKGWDSINKSNKEWELIDCYNPCFLYDLIGGALDKLSVTNAAFVDYDNRHIEIIRLVSHQKKCELGFLTTYAYSTFRQNASFDEIKDVVLKSPGDLLIKRLNFGKEEFACPQSGKINKRFVEDVKNLLADGAAFAGNDEEFCIALRNFCKSI